LGGGRSPIVYTIILRRRVCWENYRASSRSQTTDTRLLYTRMRSLLLVPLVKAPLTRILCRVNAQTEPQQQQRTWIVISERHLTFPSEQHDWTRGGNKNNTGYSGSLDPRAGYAKQAYPRNQFPQSSCSPCPRKCSHFSLEQGAIDEHRTIVLEHK